MLLIFAGVQCASGDDVHDGGLVTHSYDDTRAENTESKQGSNGDHVTVSDDYKYCRDGEGGNCKKYDADILNEAAQESEVQQDKSPESFVKIRDNEENEGTNEPQTENQDYVQVPWDSVTLEADKNVDEIKPSKSSVTSNSTFFQWLRFVIEPIIEEFRDGIYPKLTEKNNHTSNVTVLPNENSTQEIEVINRASNSTNLKNSTEMQTNNSTDTGSKKVKFQCSGRNVSDNVNATVKLITSARLLQLLNFEKNDTENVTDCLLVMFYAPWCHFCAKVAPYYNALARVFPQLDFVAVDTAQFSNLLARFGTVSVPNILVFHQSRAAVKFNQTERTFENFVTFITNSTGLEPNITVNVTEADYLGPVPSVPTTEPDYLLLISWMFVIFCSSCMFIKSNKGQQYINRVRVLWQEHQHID